MRVHDMQVVQVPVADLRQHPDNPHSADMDALQQSIERNGFYAPIYVQTSTKYIIAGNHRWLYFVQHDIPTIPAIMLDVDDLTAKRMMLADNRLSALGHDDEALLFEALQDIAADDAELYGTGYTPEDYSELALLNVEPLDFVEGTVVDVGSEADHKYEVTPVELSDGNCGSFEIWHVDGTPLTPGELNKVRKGLGMRLLEREEMSQFSIESWNRRF